VGIPLWRLVLRRLVLILSTSEFQKRFMDNNATPQSIVSFKGNIGKDAFEKVKKVFSERHAGVRTQVKHYLFVTLT
jgi:hypothetical protein